MSGTESHSKHDMIAETARQCLGGFTATIVNADEFRERLLSDYPEFMSGIKDAAVRHVPGLIADYVGVGKTPQQPPGGPRIVIKRADDDSHESYEIHRD